jgi:hypothetical protein
MTRDADEPLIPNSEQEYYDGVAADGRPLNILSRHLIPPRNEHEVYPPIGPHAQGAATTAAPNSRFHLEADARILDAERAHLERVRKCVKFLEGTVELGEIGRAILATQAEIELELKRRRLARLKAAPLDELVEGEENAPASSAAPAAGRPAPEFDTDQQRPGTAETPAPQTAGAAAIPKAPAPQEPREPREPRAPRAPRFSAALLITLALRAAKELPALSAELRDLESRLRPAEAELKLKQEFYLDKAVAVITDTLSCMDEKFGKLGFGNWMPFRFLDQWLMFCGVLNRVLAAHGLVPSGHAALYRKLLEETPSISPAAADAGPPKSWGLGYRVREHRHFQTMLDRILENRAGRGPPL